MWFMPRDKLEMPDPKVVLPGRDQPMWVPATHFVNGQPLAPPYPPELELAMFGMGCFWGAERMFWQMPGVSVTAVGYSAGYTANPTYGEVCSGRTGHNEVVRVVFDSGAISYDDLLRVFWEGHDPTQGMAQGNDRGTQYRSGLYCYTSAQKMAAKKSRSSYGVALKARGLAPITTEIIDAPTFYFAEDEHQQYLGKRPGGYCGLGGTGVRCS